MHSVKCHVIVKNRSPPNLQLWFTKYMLGVEEGLMWLCVWIIVVQTVSWRTLEIGRYKGCYNYLISTAFCGCTGREGNWT